MTTTDAHVVAAPVAHPLSMLSASEVDAMRDIIAEAGLVDENTSLAYVGLDEAPKSDLLAYRDGDAFNRRIAVTLLDRATGTCTIASVDVTAGEVATTRVVDAAAGQAPMLDSEFEAVESVLQASAEWAAALERRGLDVTMVRAAPLSAGNFGDPDEHGRRMCRVLGFLQFDGSDLPWAHPIDGLLAYVDLTAREVFAVHDRELLDVPRQRGEWNAEPYAVPERGDLKPIEITQPDGPSFTLDDNHLTWANWRLRFTFDPREGLVLHQVGWQDGDTLRPILNRASIAEMVVPYGDPAPSRFWINYFDQGEYIFGRYANSLELGCDCLGDITYVDATIADESGNPHTITNAICIHEEDFGVLWKHTDLFNQMAETRRQRRLVVSFFLTIGNYDYGFYWYLYLDGAIQFESKSTGVLFPAAYKGPEGFSTEVAPGLGAPFHQHLFCARLDMAVDGHTNAVDEVEVQALEVGDDNPHGNAFRPVRTRLRTEATACRDADNLKSRNWVISNPDRTNSLGQAVSYMLAPEGQPALLADPSSAIHRRAAFATHHLWVTRYGDDRRWPAGEIVNQAPGGGGLPAYIADDATIDGEDIIVWHTFGLTHIPRPEEWPVMPVEYSGFKLKPRGFFDRNPALDIPAGTNGHCHG